MNLCPFCGCALENVQERTVRISWDAPHCGRAEVVVTGECRGQHSDSFSHPPLRFDWRREVGVRMGPNVSEVHGWSDQASAGMPRIRVPEEGS